MYIYSKHRQASVSFSLLLVVLMLSACSGEENNTLIPDKNTTKSPATDTTVTVSSHSGATSITNRSSSSTSLDSRPVTSLASTGNIISAPQNSNTASQQHSSHYSSLANADSSTNSDQATSSIASSQQSSSPFDFLSALDSSDDGHLADWAIDGELSLESRWSANGEGEWLQAELTTQQSLCAVGVYFYKGDERQTFFSLATSIDGVNWETALDHAESSGLSTSIEYFNFDARSTTYLKLTGHGNSSDQWNGIIEIRAVSDCSELDSISAPLPPTPIKEPEPGLTPTSEPSTVLDASAPPSNNFNLSYWKLSLPASEKDYLGEGDSDPIDILPSDIFSVNPVPLNQGFEDNDYFFTDRDGAMVFRTPLDGGVSTPNAKYLRSELRELYNWVPGKSAGNANWDNEGTHTLQGRLKVAHFWEGDPQTVVGQIHAKESHKALVKLQWDGPDKPLRAIINKDPVTGNPFSLNFTEVVGMEPFDYTIKLEDTVISITVNGETRSVTFGQNGMSSKWTDHVYYFKAGNYSQADKNCGGVFEVKFYSLSVKHK